MGDNAVFSLATDGAPGRTNEDFAIVAPELAIVIDGAGVPMTGCRHGVTWYAQQLGVRTISALIGRPDMALTDGLAEAIEHVASLHSNACDLNDPGTPCAAIGILRVGPEAVDALALSDVTVLVETAEGPQVTCDLAIEEACGTEPSVLAGLRFGTAEHDAALARLVSCQTRTRNQSDSGWWVAAAEPDAAYRASVASFSRQTVGRMVVLSDGATRPVDQMGLHTWPEYLDLLDKLSPAGLISFVRSIEVDDPNGERFPRTKRHDDATIVQFVA